MKASYFATVEQADRDALAGACVVVIDVLRASSTIIAALESGAERILPIADVATACRLARPGERIAKILAGERKGVPVEGFDLGNSPLEFTRERVSGKTIVLTTTNGTRAIAAASKAERVVVCSFANVDAVAEAVGRAESLAVLCCGTEGAVASEDLLCGGMLLELLGNAVDASSLNDAARLSLMLAGKHGGEVETYMRACDNGRLLASLGFDADIAACAAVGTSRLVPTLCEGAIVR